MVTIFLFGGGRERKESRVEPNSRKWWRRGVYFGVKIIDNPLKKILQNLPIHKYRKTKKTEKVCLNLIDLP